jgi:hypothetical protein
MARVVIKRARQAAEIFRKEFGTDMFDESKRLVSNAKEGDQRWIIFFMRLPTLLAIIGLALITAFNLTAQTVRVIFVSGQAELQRPEEPALRPAVKGETVIIGTRIVTGADGRLVLTPMPGVKSIVTPNTTLLLESVSETRTSETNVTHAAVLELKEGNVISDLQKPEGVTYDYGIRTARGLAGARGTTFSVGINAAGIQTVSVSHGAISLTFADGSTATLKLGQLSISKPGTEAQNVSSVENLSDEDKAAAQEIAEQTVAAIAEAVEAGIELDPAALDNALQTAESLGITLSPATQAAVEKAQTTLLNKTQDTADPLKSVDNPPKDITSIVSQLNGGSSALDVFRASLPAEFIAFFDTLPPDLKLLLVQIGDLDLAKVALSPDPDSGLHYTTDDLRLHLTAFANSTPATLSFIKKIGGGDFEYTPDPSEFSAAAFERTIASFNALSSTDQNLVISLGAGEAIMNKSADYISALLASLDSTERNTIIQTGWGYRLNDAAQPTAKNLLALAASSFNSNELAAIKFFDIDPEVFRNSFVITPMKDLAALSLAQKTLIRQLGLAETILFSASEGSVSSITANIFNFYGQLSAGQQEAVRALGIGHIMAFFAPSDSIGESSVTALDRVKLLANFYLNNPSLQEALRDTELFNDSSLLFGSDSLDTAQIQAALAAYVALPARTRLYLNISHDYNFLELANPNPSSENVRPLAEINTLISSLSVAEFATLLDLKISEAIFSKGYFDGEGITDFLGNSTSQRLATLKSTIAFYNQLSLAKKFAMQELAIVGDNNLAFIGADSAGLDRLLIVYSSLGGDFRAKTEKLYEFENIDDTSFGTTSGPVKTTSFFFPAGYESNHIIQNVVFRSTGDLYVGATRYLRLDGFGLEGLPTFQVGPGKDLFLYAADLIDLNSTVFSNNIRGITMAAATINLTNIDFPATSVVSLNSKNGQLNFGSSTNNGKVNFNNVSYGGNLLISPGDLSSPFGANGNIAIGTLANPAALPTHTPLPIPN